MVFITRFNIFNKALINVFVFIFDIGFIKKKIYRGFIFNINALIKKKRNRVFSGKFNLTRKGFSEKFTGILAIII